LASAKILAANLTGRRQTGKTLLRSATFFETSIKGRKQMKKAICTALCVAFSLGFAAVLSTDAQAQSRTLKMQSSWPASLTLQENFTYFAERVNKLSGGTLKIDAMPAGQVVPAFEVLDATHKKVIDGAHSWAGYWTGKNKASILFTGGPATFGMDMIDGMDQVGRQRDLPDLVDQVAEAECGSSEGTAGEARRAGSPDAGGNPARVPERLG
jgi:hypothetical protein